MSKLANLAWGVVSATAIVLLGVVIIMPIVREQFVPLLPAFAETGSAVNGMATGAYALFSSLPLPTIIAVLGVILGLLMIFGKHAGVGTIILILAALSLFVGTNNVATVGNRLGEWMVTPSRPSTNTTSVRPVVIEARSSGQIIAPVSTYSVWLQIPRNKCIHWWTNEPEDNDVRTKYVNESGEEWRGDRQEEPALAQAWKSNLTHRIHVFYETVSQRSDGSCPTF